MSENILKQREEEINQILHQQPVDIQKLRQISKLPGGFLNNRIRSKVWPKILNINRYLISDYRLYKHHHRDDVQIQCDVERSLYHLSTIKNYEIIYRERRRGSLSGLINALLCHHEGLFYYQGFHDIVTICMIIFHDDHLTFKIIEKLSLNFFNDYMKKDFLIVSKFINFLFIILKVYDTKLYDFLKHIKLEPYFATSWLITWFAHDIKSIPTVIRLYDALISSHPSFSFYISAAYMIQLRTEILHQEYDFASLHNFLVKAPETIPMNADEVILLADRIFKEYPPDRLRNFCDDELATMMRRNKIGLFSRPSHWYTHVDSDWVLLKNMRIGTTDTSNYPFLRHYAGIAISWGWQTLFGYSDFLLRKEKAKLEGKGQFIEPNRILNNLFWSMAVLTGVFLSYMIVLHDR